MKITSGMFSSQRTDWRTPTIILEELRKEFGDLFDVSDRHDGTFDALTMEWPNPWYCNPPYGRKIGKWTCRMKGNGIALLPARTDTAWFHMDVLPVATEIRFVRGRLHFDERGPAPFPSMIVVYGFGKVKQ